MYCGDHVVFDGCYECKLECGHFEFHYACLTSPLLGADAFRLKNGKMAGKCMYCTQ